MRQIEEPTVTEDNSVLGGTVTRHPSFGQISVTRSSGRAHLYGSDFTHQHTIRLRIAQSHLRRRLSDDSPHAESMPLIELNMSEAQWAHFISSIGIGEGTQCTLNYFNGVSLPGLPAPKSRAEQFARESDQGIEKAMNSVKEAMEAVTDSKLSKKDKDLLLSKLRAAHMDIGDNRDFVAERFAEHIETVVEQGKNELNAYALRTGGPQQATLSQDGSPMLSLPGENKSRRD